MSSHPAHQRLPVWMPILCGALAGGMGWGIRGQYGHETGAMMAGSLVSLVLILLFVPGASAVGAARAAAWGAIAMGFGGSMTYGQTVGLTHDPALVGNWGALRWGLLGLALKGSLWIGFGGTFLGMGLGGVRYRTREVALLMVGLLVLCPLGVWLLNRPFDPAHHVVPAIYFSADWRWQPGATLKPRPEVWGGFLFALVGLLVYCGAVRRDRLALNLGLWAVLGGAVGFPLGQCLQAFHAWNPEVFRTGLWAGIDPVMNWWNWMETTFGTVMGAALGLGLWLNMSRIRIPQESTSPPGANFLAACLLGVHVALLIGEEFTRWPIFQRVYDFGLLLGFLPILAVNLTRWTPFLLVLPITALPIIGKTVRELVYQNPILPPAPGWLVFGVVPLAVAGVVGIAAARRAEAGARAGDVMGLILLVATWLYWALNFAFFRFPWPRNPWTYRTPNALWYTVCAIGLTWVVINSRRENGGALPSLSPAR